MLDNLLTDEYPKFQELYYQNYNDDMRMILSFKSEIEGLSVQEISSDKALRICNFFSSFLYNTCEMIKWLYCNKGLMPSQNKECLIKDAYYGNIIQDGRVWLDMLGIAQLIRQDEQICTPDMAIKCLRNVHINAMQNLNETIGAIILNDK